MTRLLIAVLGVVGIEAGCLNAFAPDVGPRVTPTTDATTGCAGDSDPAVDVHYATDLFGGVFQRNRCLTCHTGGGMGVQQSGFDLSSYSSMRTGGGRSGASIVIAGMPCASILVQKIETSPPFGRRMPYNGPPYLSTTDITLIRDWIAEGARDN